MLTWLFKNKIPVTDSSSPREAIIPDGYIAPQSHEVLLMTPRRQKLLAHIWQRTSISRKQFDTLYLNPIQRYALLVQQFPASESHHHAYMGGMLDHGLEIMAYALKLRQSYLLPIGSTPEEQAAKSEVWSAGVAYAALLHDIGKIAVDIHVEYENGHEWHPWHGVVVGPYRFKYKQDREYRLHSAAAGLLYTQILDDSILDWLSQTPKLWSALLYVLSGQLEHTGILGEIVTKADQASVAQELGGDPAKVMVAPKHALQRKLLDGLRYLVKEELKLNNNGPSDGWLTDDALWLVSKTVSDKLRAHLLSQGIDGIPSKNSAIFDVLQEHGIIQATPESKAIWSATIESESGWSNKFTFLKLSPALIWDAQEKPDVFSGIVTAAQTVATDESTEIATDVETNPPKQPKAGKNNHREGVDVHEADSLSAIFDLLDLDKPKSPESSQKIHETQAEEQNIEGSNVIKPIDASLNCPANLINDEEVAITTDKKSTSIIKSVIDQSNASCSYQSIEPSGEHFFEWLKEAILTKKLIINDTKALVHTVADTLYIVTPGIFNRYVQEFPIVEKLAREEGLKEFRWIQRRFEKLHLHKKQAKGFNIWTCEVKGPRRTKKLHGYLLENPQSILPEIAFNNPFLTLIKDQN